VSRGAVVDNTDINILVILSSAISFDL